MVHILLAWENDIFFKQRFESVGLLQISIQIFAPLSFLIISKKGSLVWLFSIVNWILLLIWFNIENKWFSFIKLTFSNIWQLPKYLNLGIFTENLNCESNLIHVVICHACKEEYIEEIGCLVKKRINIYIQHIGYPRYQQLAVKENLRSCKDGKFHMFPCFKILQ